MSISHTYGSAEQPQIVSIDALLLNSAERIPHIKARLKQYIDTLALRSSTGTPILSLITAHSDFLDHLLITCWHHFFCNQIDHLALIAVGGYGRRELHPYSDIDILILLEEGYESRYQSAIEAFVRFLWDVGLNPAHSVRTLEQCVVAAGDDQTIATALMESRWLTGSQALFNLMKEQTGPDHLWPSACFFEAKIEERRVRYSKFHDTAYKLEPNVKKGPGGLRDIQLIAWVIKRHYNAPTLHELVQYGCLTESEYVELRQAQKFLWEVRFALHILTHRCEDRLLFDYQKAVAIRLGFGSTENSSAIEQFMQQYYRTIMAVERLSDMLLQLFRENYLHLDSDCAIKPLTDSFQSLCGYIEVCNDQIFQNQPLALLEIFLLQQQHPFIKGIRANTIRLIRQNLHKVNDSFRQNPEACLLFLEILRQPDGITHQLRRMNRYGILAAYFPDFANIVGRMQYDLFHIYTVDEHSMFVIRNLRRFALEQFKHELPFCNEIFKLIHKPELLYLAGLLHDIAKGKGGDHSQLGATIAEDFCRRHRLIEQDTLLVQWLVRNHLFMSMTAQKKDITDPDVVHQFATQVGHLRYLNYLYLLTVADIRATNPELWNAWKDTLLKDLYIKTHLALHRGLDNPIKEKDIIRARRQEAMTQLGKLGMQPNAIHTIWKTLGSDYFLRYSAEEISWHCIAIHSTSAEQLPMVLLRPESQHGAAEIFLYCKDEPHVFAQTTHTLDHLNLTIHDARIMTSANGYVLNSYLILNQSGESVDDLYTELAICDKLKKCITSPVETSLSTVKHRPGQNKHFIIPTQIFYHTDLHNRHTILELVTTDRLGLLSTVGQVFIDFRIRLYNAKIATLGSRAEDIFYITDKNVRPLANNMLKTQLTQALFEALANL